MVDQKVNMSDQRFRLVHAS